MTLIGMPASSPDWATALVGNGNTMTAVCQLHLTGKWHNLRSTGTIYGILRHSNSIRPHLSILNQVLFLGFGGRCCPTASIDDVGSQSNLLGSNIKGCSYWCNTQHQNKILHKIRHLLYWLLRVKSRRSKFNFRIFRQVPIWFVLNGLWLACHLVLL